MITEEGKWGTVFAFLMLMIFDLIVLPLKVYVFMYFSIGGRRPEINRQRWHIAIADAQLNW